MTNPSLSNFAGNTEAVLWQYDQAVNLIKVLNKWNAFAKKSTEDFWDDFNTNVLNIDTADEFGLNVWGMAMGIKRPKVKIGSADPIFISDDLYRRLLKARFYIMMKPPTIPNYNRFLEILFPAKNRILPSEGENPSGEVTRYYARNKVLDFSNVQDTGSRLSISTSSVTKAESLKNELAMTMGFTFPQDASDEEAYLIFQHYDLIYPFPAGIRTANSFRAISRSIGFDSQGMNNFANGFAWADSSANGGIFSGTNESNYFNPPALQGKVYIVEVLKGYSKSIKMGVSGEVWIDWGDSDFSYLQGSVFNNTYAIEGRYAIAVYYGSGQWVNTPPMDVLKTYDLI